MKTTRDLRSRLPRVDARASRAVMRLAGVMARGGLDCQWSSVGEGAHRSTPACWVEFEGECGSVFVCPVKAGGDHVPLVSTKLGPDMSALAAALSRIEPLIQDVERVMAAALIPIAVTDEVPSDLICVRVADARGNVAWIAAPASAIERYPKPSLGIVHGWLASLRINSRVLIGSDRIDATTIASLERGDVLRLVAPTDRWWAKVYSPRASGLSAFVAFHPRKRQIEFLSASDRLMAEASQSQFDAASSAVDSEANWAVLPIRVKFELPSVVVSVGALSGLHPGAVISLGRTASIPIIVSAEDRTIGEGELVAVGDGYGVRMLKLA